MLVKINSLKDLSELLGKFGNGWRVNLNVAQSGDPVFMARVDTEQKIISLYDEAFCILYEVK